MNVKELCKNAQLQIRINKLERELKEKEGTIKVLSEELNRTYEKLWKAERNR